MCAKTIRSAWAEINLDNLQYNLQSIQNKVGNERNIMAVLKADAYGHGAIKAAEVLRQCGISRFAVATVSEALALRQAGATEQIVILTACPESAANLVAEYDLSPLIGSYDNAVPFIEAAKKVGKVFRAFIAIDTGMTRAGFATTDTASISEVKKLSQLEGYEIMGLFSHFATSDEADKTFTREQTKIFNDFYDAVTAEGVTLPEKCLANSGAIMEFPEAWFDTVRPGIILYGCYPSAEVDKNQLNLKPVMSVKAKIIRLRKIDADTTVSYGRHFTADGECLVATIPIGYADGYPRLLSSKGKALIRGQYAPVIGNVCMDQCMLDVSNINGVREGDIVTLMGEDGNNAITADEIADLSGTINYEILCGFGLRLAKIYHNQKGENI